MKKDLIIVGGGLCGLLTAHLASQSGLSALLVEKNTLLSGKSVRSTAKAITAPPLLYSHLCDNVSRETAGKTARAMTDGLSLLKAVTASIPGSAKKADMLLYSKYGARKLRHEYETVTSLGIPCGVYSKNAAPIPEEHECAVRLYDQLELNLPALAYGIRKAAKFEIAEHKRAQSMTKHSVTVEGERYEADAVVCATNYPALPSPLNPLRLYRKTSSVVVSERADCEILENCMAYCCDLGYGIRHTPEGGLMVSGEAHRGAPENGTMDRLTSVLEKIAPRTRVKDAWCNNDTYTHDRLPYIGQAANGVYIACGFSAWGMVSSAVAATVLVSSVRGAETEYGDVFSLGRNVMRGGGESISEHLSRTLKSETKKFAPPPERRAEELKNGEGGIINRHGKRMGGYRDEAGELHVVNLTCPHMGCELEWNKTDKTWDCPCHGTRMDYMGKEL